MSPCPRGQPRGAERIPAAVASALLAAALMVAPATSSAAAGGDAGPKPPQPATFRVRIALGGEYRYQYSAKKGPANEQVNISDERVIHFFPSISYPTVRLYSAGVPPASGRDVVAKEGTAPELVGSWGIVYFDPTGEDSCQASGGLSPNPASRPVLTAHFASHRYALSVRAVGSGHPFLYTSTEIGGPCGVSDPWSEWVVRNGVANQGVDTFTAGPSVSQRRLRAVGRGHPLILPVSLMPSEGLTSTDCGSAPSLQVACSQKLEWSGEVTISRAKRPR
jgi:hypothetical protein